MTKSEKNAESEMSSKLDEPKRHQEPKEQLKEMPEFDLKPYSESVLVGTLAITAAMWFYQQRIRLEAPWQTGLLISAFFLTEAFTPSAWARRNRAITLNRLVVHVVGSLGAVFFFQLTFLAYIMYLPESADEEGTEPKITTRKISG